MFCQKLQTHFQNIFYSMILCSVGSDYNLKKKDFLLEPLIEVLRTLC